MPFLEESSTVLVYYGKPWVAQKFAERGGLRLQQLNAAIRRGDNLGSPRRSSRSTWKVRRTTWLRASR